MKRILTAVITLIIMLGCLAGCGASGNSAAKDAGSAPGYSTGGGKDEGYEDSDGGASSGDTGSYSLTTTAGQALSLTDKIIYTYYAYIETTKFDESISNIYALLDRYGAFIESSNVSGSSYYYTYYGYQTYRHAEFAIRIPKDSYQDVTQSLSVLGNITDSGSNIQNITEKYMDTEARLTTYKTEEERLLSMLEKAETVEDMLAIESQLSDVRYEIESLTSSLRNWDNEINYCTVTISLSEVEELSEKVETQRTYWEEISDGLSTTMKSIGRFFKDLFKYFVIALPWIAVIVAAILVIALILRPISRRTRARSQGARLDGRADTLGNKSDQRNKSDQPFMKDETNSGEANEEHEEK